MGLLTSEMITSCSPNVNNANAERVSPGCCFLRANVENRTEESGYFQSRQLSHVTYTGHID